MLFRSPLAVHVVRNLAAEQFAHWAIPFLRLSGFEPTFTYSGYDDSFGEPLPPEAELIIFLVDWERIHLPVHELMAWLEIVLERSTAATRAPKILVTHEAMTEERDLLLPLSDLPQTSDVILVQPRVKELMDDTSRVTFGTPFYGMRALELARQIGLDVVPRVMQSGARLVICDLDNTLYDGVLAEDGVSGLRSSDDHGMVRQLLHEIAQRGVPVAACSKNAEEDVQDLLESGALLPLTLDDFAMVSAGWEPKPNQVRSILESSRLLPDQVLVLDDNPGELSQLIAEIPGLRVLPAHKPAKLKSALQVYPGLQPEHVSATNTLRSRDMQANRQRDQFANVDPKERLRELDVILTLTWGSLDNLDRLLELSVKTNQFNTNLRRLKEHELRERVCADPPLLVQVSLRDRFADSGWVGMVSGFRRGSEFVVDEISVSCRALGRGLEDLILQQALTRIQLAHDASRVIIESRQGPRNQPAVAWISRSCFSTEGGRQHEWFPSQEVSELREFVRLNEQF